MDQRHAGTVLDLGAVVALQRRNDGGRIQSLKHGGLILDLRHEGNASLQFRDCRRRQILPHIDADSSLGIFKADVVVVTVTALGGLLHLLAVSAAHAHGNDRHSDVALLVVVIHISAVVVVVIGTGLIQVVAGVTVGHEDNVPPFHRNGWLPARVPPGQWRPRKSYRRFRRPHRSGSGLRCGWFPSEKPA